MERFTGVDFDTIRRELAYEFLADAEQFLVLLEQGQGCMSNAHRAWRSLLDILKHRAEPPKIILLAWGEYLMTDFRNDMYRLKRGDTLNIQSLELFENVDVIDLTSDTEEEDNVSSDGGYEGDRSEVE